MLLNGTGSFESRAVNRSSTIQCVLNQAVATSFVGF